MQEPASTEAESDPFGAACWRNWMCYEPGAPPGFEATLYSDASFSGGPAYPGIGPYSLFNVLSIPDGELHEALVVRGSWHYSARPELLRNADLLPKKSQTDSWLGVSLDQEIAALLALFVGRRVWSGGYTREFRSGDPAGEPVAFEHERPNWQRSKRPVLPGLAGGLRAPQVSLDGVRELFMRLPSLTARDSVAFVRAARLYQMAIWVADQDPELAWLQLVSAVEVAATRWHRDAISATVALTEALPDLVTLLQNAGGDELVVNAAATLSELLKSTRRFLEFMVVFDPGPPRQRCPEAMQVPWHSLRKRLALIYKYRSKRLHSGEPFPQALLEPPTMFGEGDSLGQPSEIPPGLEFFVGPSRWVVDEIPMQLWLFERTVRGALLRWFIESLANGSSA